jgi:hypothetical protein
MIKTRKMLWAGHAARMGKKRSSYMLLLGKPDGRRLLGVDNIEMSLGDRMGAYFKYFELHKILGSY